MKNRRAGLLGLFCSICLLAFLQPVFAHGGGRLYVSNQSIGDYSISVWVNPPSPKANQNVHLTIGIGGQRQEPILDAQLLVSILDINTGLPITSAPATTEQSINRLFYEADFSPLQQGEYEVIVDVDDIGNVSFLLMVKSAVTIWPYVGLGAVGGITAVIIFHSWHKQTRSATLSKQPKRKSRLPSKIKRT